MATQPRTWIVGAVGDGDFAARCLLQLEQRFALPPTVVVCHGEQGLVARSAADEDGRVLTFVPDPPGVSADFLGLLRHEDARAAFGARASASTVAIGVARSRQRPIEDAVHLAVTTLIDWGHDIAIRADALQPAG